MIPMIDIGQRLAHSSEKYTPPPEEEEEEAVEQDTEGRREWRKAGEQGKEERRTEEGGGRKKRRKERMERREKGRERKEDNHLARTLEQWLSAYAALKRWQDIQSSFSGIRPSVMGSIPRWPTLFVSGRHTPIWVPCRNTAGIMCPSRLYTRICYI